MKKRWSILSAVLCVALLTGGCGTGSKNDAGTGKEQTFSHETREGNEHQSNLDVLQPSAYGNVQGLNLEKGSSISIIGRGSSSAYWKAVQEGAKQAVADINTNLGYKGNDKVKLVYSAPETENDVDDQVNILDEELARYPVAVGIAAVDSGACEVQFDLAAENGIPIVAFDSGTDYQNIVSMIDTDNTTAAATAASKLCNSIGESGQILVIAHDSKADYERQKGKLAKVQETYHEKEVLYENLQERVGEFDEMNSEEIERLKNKQGVELAMEQLTRLAAQMQSRTSDLMNTEVSAIMDAITDGKYNKLWVDENLHVQLMSNGKKISMDQVSRGTLEQIYFAIRMAATKILHEEECPVILDDTFGYYDDSRLAQTLRWLKDSKRQIIIFSCQKREMEMLEKIGCAYHKVML